MSPHDPILTPCGRHITWRLAILALLVSFAGCASQPKETVDYGYGMQFEQPMP